MHDSYAAGLVDGEGYIGVAHIKVADTYAIRVAVAMVTKGTPILATLQRRYGGRLNDMKPETERNAAKTRWVVDGHVAHAFLSVIIPYLILKQDQALISIQIHEEIAASRASRGRYHWTDQLRHQCEVAKLRIHDLNARGPQRAAPILPARTPIAIYRWGEWWKPEDSLFGPVEFTGGFPAHGMMVAGHVYKLPAPLMAPSVPLALLPTPTATPYGNNQSRSPGAKVRPSLNALLREIALSTPDIPNDPG